MIKNGCHCILRIRGTQGCALVVTTLGVSDLHNALAPILDPFYNREYEMIKKMTK